jgi:hypothetical protein
MTIAVASPEWLPNRPGGPQVVPVGISTGVGIVIPALGVVVRAFVEKGPTPPEENLAAPSKSETWMAIVVENLFQSPSAVIGNGMLRTLPGTTSALYSKNA